jgi:hypothetical protein
VKEITGQIAAWVKPNGASPDEAERRVCDWKVGTYPSSFGPWITFSITKGGVTGYESFVLKDDKGISRPTIEWIFTAPCWSACAGGMGWPEMRTQIEPLREIVNQWLGQEKIILSLCTGCQKVVGERSSGEAPGGVSHTICDSCLEE